MFIECSILVSCNFRSVFCYKMFFFQFLFEEFFPMHTKFFQTNLLLHTDLVKKQENLGFELLWT